MPADLPDPFPYMRWAKRNLGAYAPENLGMSGIPALSAEELPVPREIGWWAPEGEYGDPALRAAIASRAGVPESHVFVSAGCSTANFLVYLAEARGGHVAVETPGYEALLGLPAAVSASVSTFRRVEGQRRRIDPVSLAAALRPETRLIVVSDLHNPTGLKLHAEDLALLCAHAEALNAAVLVDEVYLELALEPARTAALAHPRVIVTNSLTKAHGLGGLRIGWILAQPARIERIAIWNDLVCPAHPVPSIAVAKTYLPAADRFLERTRARIRPRLDQVDRWVRARGDVSWERPDGAISGFLRLPRGMDGDRLAEHAQRAHGVRVVPGSFFQEPDHVRLSYGLAEADLARALDALARAIDDLKAYPPEPGGA
jgi:aspartate/methionine/tyrosine aminotransferase